MSDLDFGAPVPVTPDSIPKGTSRGRKSAMPALQAWIAQLPPEGTFELASKDEDGAHPVSRVQQIRKVAGETVRIETAPVTPGKRYRIFATVNGATPPKS